MLLIVHFVSLKVSAPVRFMPVRRIALHQFGAGERIGAEKIECGSALEAKARSRIAGNGEAAGTIAIFDGAGPPAFNYPRVPIDADVEQGRAF